ncbi:MAG: hypothetical protein F4X64_14865 [Chloroflexi bacterium]|nr:hypothetical protein [Chloroflexota bacterium]
MTRDYREFIKERIAADSDFGNGLYQYCTDLLQSSDVEDRRDGESMLRNYFGADALRAARLEADTPVEPASNAAN